LKIVRKITIHFRDAESAGAPLEHEVKYRNFFNLKKYETDHGSSAVSPTFPKRSIFPGNAVQTYGQILNP